MGEGVGFGKSLPSLEGCAEPRPGKPVRNGKATSEVQKEKKIRTDVDFQLRGGLGALSGFDGGGG